MPQSPAEFFAERGFELRYHDDGEGTWADLASRRRSLLRRRRWVVPNYGSGEDEATAARSAMERWQNEQAT